MTSSDIIAIIAIISSLAVSIISSLFNYFINRTNVSAKRSELALEKRLEAFSKVYAEIGKQNEIIAKFNYLFILTRSEVGFAQMFGQVNNQGTYDQTIYDDFKRGQKTFDKLYDQQRVYIPMYIDKKIQLYRNEVLWDLLSDKEYDNIYESIQLHLGRVMSLKETLAEDILLSIHKFIGLK